MLLHYVAKILDKATQVDDAGVEYYNSVELEKPFIEDLARAFKFDVAQQDIQKEERTWEMYKELLSNRIMSQSGALGFAREAIKKYYEEMK